MIIASARKPGVHNDDLVMLIGPSRTGQLLEIGVTHADGIGFIIAP